MVAVATPSKQADSAVAAAPKRKVGRPAKGTKLLTPEVRKVILDCIGEGLPLDVAALNAGVSYRSISRWKEWDEAFHDECKQAEARAQRSLVSDLKSKAAAGNKVWTANAWMLERRFGWHPVSRSEITGKDGGPIQHLTIAKQILLRAGAKGEPKKAEPVDV